MSATRKLPIAPMEEIEKLLGSTREALACVEIAMALGYIHPVSPEILDRFQHVIGWCAS